MWVTFFQCALLARSLGFDMASIHVYSCTQFQISYRVSTIFMHIIDIHAQYRSKTLIFFLMFKVLYVFLFVSTKNSCGKLRIYSFFYNNYLINNKQYIIYI